VDIGPAVSMASSLVVTMTGISKQGKKKGALDVRRDVGGERAVATAIHYNTGILYIRDFMTHAEYSKNKWKERH
jgi:mRNA-degrading endonuclease HigB of HigAB toxin-antitoxin module